MDSGKSGSMQSSSGGDDEELDAISRAESFSSFLNPSHHFTSPNNNNISSTPYLNNNHNITTTFYNPPHNQTSHNLDDHHLFPPPSNPITQYNHSINNNDLFWSRPGSRPETNYPNFPNLTPPTQSLPSITQQTTISTTQTTISSEAHQERGSAHSQSDQVSKNPKKRTRASRRAPTTILTTDTANFRQMVQEFTGIPAAPFSGSPYSGRLDLFSTASALRTGTHLDSLGPLYPPRPSANKVPSPSLLNSTMVDAIVTNSTIKNAAGANINSNSYPFTSGHHLLNLQKHHHHNGKNIQAVDFENMSGLPTQGLLIPSSSSGTVGGGDNDNVTKSRWKSGETVRSSTNDGVHENMVTLDGNNVNWDTADE